jgi:hypothetical protein
MRIDLNSSGAATAMPDDNRPGHSQVGFWPGLVGGLSRPDSGQSVHQSDFGIQARYRTLPIAQAQHVECGDAKACPSFPGT